MRLNVQTDYALRLLLVLGTEPERRWALPEVAGAYGISLEHLRKVTQRLVKHGLVVSTRGRNGGVELAPGGLTTKVGAVVRLMEPDLALVECLGSANRCRVTPACKLVGVLARARAAFLAELDRVTLGELVDAPNDVRKALGLPAVGAA